MSTAATTSTIAAKVVTPLRADQIRILKVCNIILKDVDNPGALTPPEMKMIQQASRYLTQTTHNPGYNSMSMQIRDQILFSALKFLSKAVEDSPNEVGQEEIAQLKQSGACSEPEELTPREVEVLKLIADGFCNKEIAVQLGVGVRTVETHRERIMRRLDIHNVACLTHYAIKHRLVPLQ